MNFLYGLAKGNSSEARRLYQERYPYHACPDKRTFVNIHRRLTESGSFSSKSPEGRLRKVRTPAVEEAVLNAVQKDPSTSTREIGRQLDICHKTVWEILRESSCICTIFKEFKAHLPRDFEPRVVFCRCYLDRLIEKIHISLRKSYLWTKQIFQEM